MKDYDFKYHVVRINGLENLENNLNYWKQWPSIEIKKILPIDVNYYDVIFIKWGEK